MYKNISIRKKAICTYCFSIFLDFMDRSSTNDRDRCNETSTRAETSTMYNDISIKSKLPVGGLEFARDNEAITGGLGRDNNDRVTMRKTRDSG